LRGGPEAGRRGRLLGDQRRNDLAARGTQRDFRDRRASAVADELGGADIVVLEVAPAAAARIAGDGMRLRRDFLATSRGGAGELGCREEAAAVTRRSSGPLAGPLGPPRG
jgi:hypothetical protein